VLVAPRRHVPDILDLTAEENRELFALVRETAGILRKATGCEGMNIGLNLGTSGGAGIAEHVHVHLVPRWAGDSNFMPVVADTRVMPEHLDEAWKRLRPSFE
jgi:ATP adenylyltransferase